MMDWRVVIRPEAEGDIVEAASWYEAREEGLGTEFREAIIQVLDELAENPFLNSRQPAHKHIRWRYAKNFPYRVIYKVIEAEKVVVVATILHAARHESQWKKRV